MTLHDSRRWLATACCAFLCVITGHRLHAQPREATAPRRLNNLTCELLSAQFAAAPERDCLDTPWQELTFAREQAGWIFIRLDAEMNTDDRLWVGLDAAPREDAILALGGARDVGNWPEAMHLVNAGPHRLRLWTQGKPVLSSVVVRAVPEILVYMIECLEPESPTGWYSHSREFLSRTILRNCNVVVSHCKPSYADLSQEWRATGRKWLANQGMSALRDPEVDLYGYWRGILESPTFDGVIHDEVLRTDATHYERWAEPLRRIRQDPELDGKHVYLFSGWGIVDNAGQDVLFTIDEGTAALGKRSLLCLPSPSRLLTHRQYEIALEPDRPYTLSAFFKTQDFLADGPPPGASRSGAYNGIFVINDGWFSTCGSVLKPAPGTNDWHRLSVAFRPPPSRNGKYQLVICSPLSGRLWLDAVQLEAGERATDYTERTGDEPATAPANLLLDGSFEFDHPGWPSEQLNLGVLLDTVTATGARLAPEAYKDEQPTAAKARSLIETHLIGTMNQWRAFRPEIEKHMTLIFSAGNGALRYANDKVPTASYKTLLDLQFHAIANDGAFTDLAGVGFWSMHYIDEELVRWYSALFRHYLIEGRTERLSNDPYDLDHVANPGFEDGATGWSLAPAAERSMAIVSVRDALAGVSKSRYSPVPEGRFLLRTSRSPGKPNALSQDIRNLDLGRLYSVMFYTASPECANLLTHASVQIDGGTLVKAKCHDRLWTCKDVFWTMHYRVFRATATRGRLTLSDAPEAEQSQTAGLTDMLWDFVQVEPYFDETEQD